MDLSIIEYNDYVEFLNDFAIQKKEQNKGWSFNVWARQIGITDPSLLRKVTKGLRTPNQELCKKLSTYFKFSKEESDFFAVLVELRKINLPQEKKEEVLGSFRSSILSQQYNDPKQDVIPMSTTWKHSMLYSFAMLKRGMSLEMIKKCSTVKISDEEMLKIINDLIHMGLLYFSDDGTLLPKETDGVIVKKKQDVSDPDCIELQRQATQSFLDALNENIFQNKTASLSVNVISQIPMSKLDDFKEELRNKIMEVLFKYDQLDPEGDKIQIFNTYLGGYSVFNVEKSETVKYCSEKASELAAKKTEQAAEFMKEEGCGVHFAGDNPPPPLI
jgi:uncharacterized protein (TIGR02147 family)